MKPFDSILLENLLADRPVDHLVHVLDRAEQERQRQHVDDGRRIADRADIDAVEIDRADAGLLDGLALLAELARMEDPDTVASAGPLCHQLVHVTQRLHGRVVLLLDVGSAELAGDQPGPADHARTAQVDAHSAAVARLLVLIVTVLDISGAAPARRPPSTLIIRGLAGTIKEIGRRGYRYGRTPPAFPA